MNASRVIGPAIGGVLYALLGVSWVFAINAATYLIIIGVLLVITLPRVERDPDEVRHAGGGLVTLEGTACRNPAFDVTPAALVTALVTEHGAARPVTAATVAALVR